MKYWTKEHAALLAALRAGAIVPALVRRLSLERVSPVDAEIRRLRGWASDLRDDAGWTAIEPVLDNPAAWPGAWNEAVELGFAPRTDHHHALLFEGFCRRFTKAADWESAGWTGRQGIDAWARVFASTYPGELYDDVDPTLSDDGPDRAELLRTMLDGLVPPRVEQLREASGVARPGVASHVERRRLRYAWRALAHLSELPTDPDPYGTLARLDRLATEARHAVSAEIVARFEKAVEELDLSEASGEALLGPFQWVSAYFDVVGYSELAVTTVVSAVVDTAWGLRRVGRDDGPDFKVLFDIGTPFNKELFQRLSSFESAFGHNSRCADFLVFVGEQQTGKQREVTFRAGLQVCPGHRNSAMLLSYELLGEATKVLNQSALTPALAAKMPGTGQRVTTLVERAAALVDEAEDVYPYNKTLPDVKTKLEDEARRLNVDID